MSLGDAQAARLSHEACPAGRQVGGEEGHDQGYLASDARRCAARRVPAAEMAAANALSSAESATEEEEHLSAKAEAADNTWADQADSWAVAHDADYYRAACRAAPADRREHVQGQQPAKRQRT